MRPEEAPRGQHARGGLRFVIFSPCRNFADQHLKRATFVELAAVCPGHASAGRSPSVFYVSADPAEAGCTVLYLHGNAHIEARGQLANSRWVLFSVPDSQLNCCVWSGGSWTCGRKVFCARSIVSVPGRKLRLLLAFQVICVLVRAH